MLTFATKRPSIGAAAHGPKEDAVSFFCPRSFDRAAVIGPAMGLLVITQ